MNDYERIARVIRYLDAHHAIVIPCHRVIRETGVLGDYRWGQIRKRAMLAWESNHQ